MNESGIDEAAFISLVERLAGAGVDSIGVLGSTGNYAYLTRAERARIVQLAVRHAGTVPVIAGIGALRTRAVQELAEDAQQAGAAGVLLAPVSYQKLSDDEVFGLYRDVTRTLSVPLCVYDNPGTTHFTFSDELHGRIAGLPQVASIKIPGVPDDAEAARALQLSGRLQPMWELFRQYGSLRVTATAAELLGLAEAPSLPLPLKTLAGHDRQRLAEWLAELKLA
ncbi:dihydrodipicolinate synthase family protein [Zobellella denitrificans]|uniref:dihydrodipicolinate synthase family protein n=1 Tax=Zobellella denitrificans TaxID=347534 RepID=UPI000B8C47F7|nr:dihydrodipicolinate synthase family protein [Zobellella denitrificans]OXS14437.1 dihydrodipicolinate synthase family protein [Zobellella denitrificans]